MLEKIGLKNLYSVRISYYGFVNNGENLLCLQEKCVAVFFRAFKAELWLQRDNRRSSLLRSYGLVLY